MQNAENDQETRFHVGTAMSFFGQWCIARATFSANSRQSSSKAAIL